MTKDYLIDVLEKHVANFFNEVMKDKDNADADPLQEISIMQDIESIAETALEIFNQNTPCDKCGADNQNKYCFRGDCNPT